jgi:hypothetical protein
MGKIEVFLSCLCAVTLARAQTTIADPQIRSRATAEGKVTSLELLPHFVTTIQLPEAVNSVVVGDPELFLVEHNDHEPNLVFAKPLTSAPAETNVLITTRRGRHISILLTSHGAPAGERPQKSTVDFVLRYGSGERFVVEPEVVPYPLVPQTTTVDKTPQTKLADAVVNPAGSQSGVILSRLEAKSVDKDQSTSSPYGSSLDGLLERQKHAVMPELHGQKVEGENSKGDRLRAGISEVLDQGQYVVVLFSVINTGHHAILLMPPQVQLGGKNKHRKWSNAEQLATIDFRLSERRIGPKERADGVVVFERPPYKQSSETLFLQMAESGAVDKPALVPIGFGVNTLRSEESHAAR